MIDCWLVRRQIMNGRRKRNGKPNGKPEASAEAAEGEAVVSVEGVQATATASTTEGESGVVAVAVLEGDAPAAAGAEGAAVTTTAIATVAGTPPVAKAKRERRSSGKVLRWTNEEETALRKLVAELGSSGQWTTIATRLGTNRTGAGVDQHWQLMTGRRKRYPNDAKAPGAASPAAEAAPAGLAVAYASVAPIYGGAYGAPFGGLYCCSCPGLDLV